MSDAIDLRLGRWQDVLADVERVDVLICDPPYSARTHDGQRHGRRPEQCNGEYVSSRGIDYQSMSEQDAKAFVEAWTDRTRGWFCVMTDSVLAPLWQDLLSDAGRCIFAPLPCVQVGMNVRLAGDGPSNWSIWLVVARPRRPPFSKWGTFRGAYIGNPFEHGENTATATRRGSVVGSKPLWLMRAIVRDYSRPGDLIVDPCAGGATTLLAAAIEGRRAVGAEMDPKTHALAMKRIAKGYTAATLFTEQRKAEQLPMLEGET